MVCLLRVRLRRVTGRERERGTVRQQLEGRLRNTFPPFLSTVGMRQSAVEWQKALILSKCNFLFHRSPHFFHFFASVSREIPSETTKLSFFSVIQSMRYRPANSLELRIPFFFFSSFSFQYVGSWFSTTVTAAS